MFAANVAVTLVTFPRAWNIYRNAYEDLPHDATAVAGTQFSTLLGLLLGVPLVVTAVILGARVLRGGDDVRVIATGVGVLAALRLCGCNGVNLALSEDTFAGDRYLAVDRVSYDLRHAVPAWAQQTALALETAVVLALAVMAVLPARPWPRAAGPLWNDDLRDG